MNRRLKLYNNNRQLILDCLHDVFIRFGINGKPGKNHGDHVCSRNVFFTIKLCISCSKLVFTENYILLNCIHPVIYIELILLK